MIAVQPEHGFAEEMAAKHSYWRLVRITAWILRWRIKKKRTGLLTTEELSRAELTWIKLVQQSSRESPKDVETICDD